jgi:hypothetical protein
MNPKSVCAVVIGVIFLIGFVSIMVTNIPIWPDTAPMVTGAGAVLWKERTFEVIFQGFVVLAGVISILLLLGPEKTRRLPP